MVRNIFKLTLALEVGSKFKENKWVRTGTRDPIIISRLF